MIEAHASDRPELSLAIPTSLSRSSSIQNSPSFLNNRQQAYDPIELNDDEAALPIHASNTDSFAHDTGRPFIDSDLDTSQSGAPQLPPILSRPLPDLSRGLSRYSSRASQRPRISQSKFLELASKNGLAESDYDDDDDNEDNDTEDSDEEESTKVRKQKSEMAKLRQRQNATLSVHRQNMKRLTGSASVMSLDRLRSSTVLSTPAPLDEPQVEGDDDEDDVPLDVLKTRGFNKPVIPPARNSIGTSISLPNQLANVRGSESPGPAARRRAYPGSPSMNSLYRMGDAPIIEGGLVGEIAKEEQAKKGRLAGHMAFDRERQRYWDSSYAQEQNMRAAESELIETLKAQISELAANQNIIMNELNNIYASPNPGYNPAPSIMGSSSLRQSGYFDQVPLSTHSAVVRDHDSHRLTNLMMQDPSELDDENQWEKALAGREALVGKWREAGLN